MKKYDKLLKLAGLSLRKRQWIGMKQQSKRQNFNSRALNTFFSGVTNEEFKKISSKEAWTILETTYEGTKVVKTVKLQRLTSSFKETNINNLIWNA